MTVVTTLLVICFCAPLLLAAPAPDLTTTHLDRAFELSRKVPMDDNNARLLIELVTLEHQLRPDRSNSLARLDPVLAYVCGDRAGEDPFTISLLSVGELMQLYLTLDSLPHAERVFAQRDCYNCLEPLGRYLIATRNLSKFDHYLISARQAASSSELPSVHLYTLLAFAEAFHTNNLPARAAGLLAEAKTIATADRSRLPPPDAPTPEELEFHQEADLQIRLNDLSQIALAQHRCALNADALKTLAELQALRDRVPRTLRSSCDAAAFDLALSLQAFKTAERLMKRIPRRERTGAICSFAVAQARAGRLDDALDRLNKIMQPEASEHAIFEIIVAYSGAHSFSPVESLVRRISKSEMREHAYEVLALDCARAGRSRQAAIYLARISDPADRSRLERRLSDVQAQPPVPLLPRPLNSGLPFCGTSAIEDTSFLHDVSHSPEKILDRIAAFSRRPHSRSRRYLIFQSVGRALAHLQAQEENLSFWTNHASTPLDQAYLHLGLAQGQTEESFYTAR